MVKGKKDKKFSQQIRPTVVDAIIIKDGKILLIKRASNPFKGKWALPGGFIKVNEDAQTALKREAKEETGLEIEPLGIIGVYSDPSRDERKTVSITFLAIPLNMDVKPQKNETSKVEWHRLDKIPKLAFDHEKIISDAISFLNESSCGRECKGSCSGCH